MIVKRTIVVFQGAFDPIHNTHLAFVKQVTKLLTNSRIYFVPSLQKFSPQLRPIQTPVDHRINMINCAIEGIENCSVNEDFKSFENVLTALTLLKQLRKDYPTASLIYMAGWDVGQRIAEWPEREELLRYGHLLIRQQAQDSLADAANFIKPLRRFCTTDIEILTSANAGSVFIYPMPLAEEISSTLVREHIASKKPINNLVPNAVAEYIKKHNLYSNI